MWIREELGLKTKSGYNDSGVGRQCVYGQLGVDIMRCIKTFKLFGINIEKVVINMVKDQQLVHIIERCIIR